MKTLLRLSVLLILVLSNAPNVLAEVRLAGIFADHMVLQRDRPIQIWGWADEGEGVTVKFGEHSAKTMAGEDRGWSVTLGPLAGSAEGRDGRTSIPSISRVTSSSLNPSSSSGRSGTD